MLHFLGLLTLKHCFGIINILLPCGKYSVSVPIAKQFLTINEKWVLVKFMKALGTFCV